MTHPGVGPLTALAYVLIIAVVRPEFGVRGSAVYKSPIPRVVGNAASHVIGS